MRPAPGSRAGNALRTARAGTCAALAAVAMLAAACSITRPPGPALPPTDQFCSVAQQVLAGTTLEPENIVLADFDAFAKSKATVRPLSTRQYNTWADGGQTRLVQVSCKLKTADHLRTEYGADAAGEEGLCADVNRRTLAAVLQEFTPDQRRNLRFDGGRAVIFDAEQVTTNGPEWLAPYPLAWQGTDGALHILAKAQRNDWLDPRWLAAPPQFRGTRYCHFIGPDQLRAILLGEVTVGTTPPPALGAPAPPGR
jgi:hypothetical protein